VAKLGSVGELLAGRHFDREVIILCVRWYLRYKISLRDLVEMMAERGLDLAHTTIMRWVWRYTPEFIKRWNHFGYGVKQSLNLWIAIAGITKGPLLRPVSKSGKVGETGLGAWSVWSVVERCAKEIGIKESGPHDLRRTCAKLCRKAGGDLEQIKFLLGTHQFRPPNATSGPSRISLSR
jgi:hypothetical protein